MTLTDLMLKEFRTEQHTYLYCSKTNQIFRVDPVMVELIPLYGQHSLQDIQQRLVQTFAPENIAENHQIVARLAQQHGFFQAGSLQIRAPAVSEESIRAELEQDIPQMCLEVTEGCNLRCHYCAYSGGYEHKRAHGARTMPKSVAQAAIDFLFQKSQQREQNISLSFYGGEPLTQLPLIKFCIEYARSLPWRHPEALSFNMTTNATLLDEDAIRFLVDNKFRLLVSLDGPAEDHDAHRVYASGGGTFSQVIANLRRFNDIAPGYPALMVNCVLTPTSDLLSINDFFVQHQDLFRELLVSRVMAGHQTLFREYPGDPDKQKQQLTTLYQQYIGAHLRSDLPITSQQDMVFIRPLFEREFLWLHRRPVWAEAPRSVEVTATCFPGRRKLFVDVQGKLHICERIVNTCSIGDVWNGFHLPTVKHLLDEYATLMNRRECLDCWALRLCPACFANMADDRHLSLEHTQELCPIVHRTRVITLQTYCAILERNPQAFKYMDEYDIS